MRELRHANFALLHVPSAEFMLSGEQLKTGFGARSILFPSSQSGFDLAPPYRLTVIANERRTMKKITKAVRWLVDMRQPRAESWRARACPSGLQMANLECQI